MKKRAIECIACAMLMSLAACGGDSDPPAPPVVPPDSPAIRGVVAIGRAMPNWTVEIKCASGSGSVKTATDGSYEWPIDTAELPCVVRAQAPEDTTWMHSLAVGSGNVTAHVTPVTEMVVTQFSGTTPDSYYYGFNQEDADAITPDAVQAAIDAALAPLTAAGIDTQAIGNPMTSALVAQHGSTPGNAHDRALDALASRLAEATPPSKTPSVATEVSGNPQAADCPSLRSGRYRRVGLSSASAPKLIEINAISLVASEGSTTTTWTPVPGEACRYSYPGGTVAVSPAGLLVGFDQVHWLAFPDQNVAWSQLEGRWSYIGSANGTERKGQAAILGDTLATPIDCAATLCATLAHRMATPHASGGFQLAPEDGGSPSRLFAFRAGGGETLLVEVAAQANTYAVWRRQRAELPPPLGNTPIWLFRMYAQPVGDGSDVEASDLNVLSDDLNVESYDLAFFSDSVFPSEICSLNGTFRLHECSQQDTLPEEPLVHGHALPVPGMGIRISHRDATYEALRFMVVRP